MNRPIILIVDDDPNVLKAVDRDLRARYARAYHIVPINRGSAALEYLKQLQQKNESIALFVVDQRMPQMSGIEFLIAARAFYPFAKKVLLTAYADTQAAVDAINLVRLDYYLMKPWGAPQDLLYPVLDDLLAEWAALMFPPGQRTITTPEE